MNAKETEGNTETIVFDTTVLITFERVREISLLGEIGRDLLIPEAVDDEFIKNKNMDPNQFEEFQKLKRREVLNVQEITGHEPNRRVEAFSVRLDPGEAEALVLADHHAVPIATDDDASRSRASDLGLTVTGTVGLLFGLIRSGALSLSSAETIHNEMIQRGYFSPIDPEEFVDCFNDVDSTRSIF